MLSQTRTDPADSHLSGGPIRVRGCRVHNLKEIDVDIPRGELVAICGLSGSGKTSLAIDTLYAEGQRCYIESFSAYTRQFLDRFDKPDCDSLDGIPPAIAVTRASTTKSNRGTVATSTEIAEHARLLFAKTGRLVCYRCGEVVEIDQPPTIAEQMVRDDDLERAMVGFEIWLPDRASASEILFGLQQEGYVRLILKEQMHRLSDDDRSSLAKKIGRRGVSATVVVDRLSKESDLTRWTESLETAMSEGNGRATIFIHSKQIKTSKPNATLATIDQRQYQVRVVSDRRRCDACDLDYPDPVPRLFNFNHPLGACPTCEGFGDVIDIDMDRVVPDPRKTLREGAIAPWTTPAYRHELDELLALADDVGLPVDVPFKKLAKKHLKIIHEGVPRHQFGGLNGFFEWLDRHKYKMHVRIFAARYRSYRTCPTCSGKRLRPEALAFRIGDRDIADFLAMRCEQADDFLASLTTLLNESADSVAEAPVAYQVHSDVDARQLRIAAEPIRQIRDRLAYLRSVGLGYLQLDRTLRTLSGGETQRIALTAALGSTLVGMLYVLDEPTAGLHPDDVTSLVSAIGRLRERGNTVLAVEHNAQVLRSADRILEIGPGAGVGGGEVIFEGTVDELVDDSTTVTGPYVMSSGDDMVQRRRQRPAIGTIELRGASGRNLQSINIDFPLGQLCVVTGRSGSGKSTLIHDTLHGGVLAQLAQRNREAIPEAGRLALPVDSLHVPRTVQDCLIVDQSPISRSPRSCPVTYAKAFDPIRRLFSETVDARIRNYKPGHFSFNSAAGQCVACEGAGVQTVDMQFLADVSVVCAECRGRRYRDEVLQVRYRDQTIADILAMTIREAYVFFREHPKVQSKLKRLIDVGLDYVTLGQPATTLSSGEAQRLKLAAFLASSSKLKTLFLMDEPTTGLHFADIAKLIECFDTLIADGHSLIVIEHHPMMIAAADHMIELGPGAAEEGGRIVASGHPSKLTSLATRQGNQEPLAAEH
ncbi:MAG: excinuclease ABC subunit UvrA [Planctomycetota bacterium]